MHKVKRRKPPLKPDCAVHMCAIFQCHSTAMYKSRSVSIGTSYKFHQPFPKAVLCPRVDCPNATIPKWECCAVCPGEPTLPPKYAVSSIMHSAAVDILYWPLCTCTSEWRNGYKMCIWIPLYALSLCTGYAVSCCGLPGCNDPRRRVLPSVSRTHTASKMCCKFEIF